MENIKFNIHDKVRILSLHKDLIGIIVSIWILDKAIRYEVRYFWENKPQEVFFYGWELEKT